MTTRHQDALEAAARALNLLWCPTCQPYEATDDAHRAYCRKSAQAAITTYLNAITSEEDVAQTIFQLIEIECLSADGKNAHVIKCDPAARAVLALVRGE